MTGHNNQPDNITVSRELLRQVLSGIFVTQETLPVYREIKALLDAPAVEPAFLGYMNAGHLQKMQQGLLHSGYVYRDGGGIDEVAVFTAPQAQQPAPPAEVPLLSLVEIADITAPWSRVRSDYTIGIARCVEQAVRQKAGLK